MFYATFVELKLDSSSFMIEHSVVLCDWSLPSDWTRRFGARGCNNRHRLGQMIERKQTGCLRFIEFLAWTVAHDAQHFVHLLLLGYCILVAVFTEIPGSDQSLCPCAWHRRHLGAVSLEPATARLSS